MPRRVSVDAEIAAIAAAAVGRSLTSDEQLRIERLKNVEQLRRSRLPRQIEAARAKLARLEAQYRG
ncbi:hypothetical protein [Sphingomonas sp. PAMC 26621]|uniref:hypothetical protein n=1 Tax=Sphingomonas sp. PAMC 26621 TaxID=1112213 RepID=UPI000289DAF7|nr:hypothetical protein [Sphingomonas sp. PAMC 26621]